MRLFAALELPAGLRAALAGVGAGRRADLPAASWVREANLHLTLLFFGEVASDLLERLTEGLRAATATFPPPELRVTAAGAFPARGPIRVVWVGVEPGAPLAALSAALREAAEAAGVGSDRKPFSAHVTLARCRPPWAAALRERLSELAPPPTRFRPLRAVLEASELGHGGAAYRVVAALPFAEAA